MATIANRYQLDREIGRGSTGAVWVGLDLQLGRKVAVKMLRVDHLENADARSRFEREARHIAKVSSPFIVQVYDSGTENGQPFIVMALLDGESLDARLRRPTPRSARVTASIVADIAKGLKAIHDAGIVHRDLKPANVFLAMEGNRESVRLVDFGLAHVLRSDCGAESLYPQHVLGTPLYMSPEQLRGDAVDERSDLWALAVIAYQMFVGQLPFSAEHFAALQAQVESGSFIRPSTLRPELGVQIDAFFERALSVDPASRFQSATRLASELSQILELDQRRVVRLLFLDDEPDMELLLRRRFRDELRDGRYQLLFCANGHAGLQELREHADIDVVLTDLNMPGMNGLTFIERVSQINPLVRVVVVSAYSDMTNIRQAMNRGAFDFLVKPIDFEDLRRTIEKCAEHAFVLRRALYANEENEILRALVGPQTVEKLVAAIRTFDTIDHEAFDASVAFIGVYGVGRVARDSAVETLAMSNRIFELFVREILDAGGIVGSFFGGVIMATFTGSDHAARAADTTMAIRDRLRALDDDAKPALAICAGIACGTLVSGGVGSRSLGRLERTYLGEPVNVAAALQRCAHEHEILILSNLQGWLSATHVCHHQVGRVVSIAGESFEVSRVGHLPTSDSRELASDSDEATVSVYRRRSERG